MGWLMVANDSYRDKQGGFECFERLLENEFEHVGGTKATKLGSCIKEIIGDAVEKKYSGGISKLKEETWKEFLSDDVKSIGYEKLKRTLSGASFSTGPKVKTNFLDKISPEGVSQHISVVLAIYYTAHISIDENLNEAAERVDLAFFGKSFEKKFGKHVPSSRSEGNNLLGSKPIDTIELTRQIRFK